MEYIWLLKDKLKSSVVIEQLTHRISLFLSWKLVYCIIGDRINNSQRQIEYCMKEKNESHLLKGKQAFHNQMSYAWRLYDSWFTWKVIIMVVVIGFAIVIDWFKLRIFIRDVTLTLQSFLPWLLK